MAACVAQRAGVFRIHIELGITIGNRIDHADVGFGMGRSPLDWNTAPTSRMVSTVRAVSTVLRTGSSDSLAGADGSWHTAYPRTVAVGVRPATIPCLSCALDALSTVSGQAGRNRARHWAVLS